MDIMRSLFLIWWAAPLAAACLPACLNSCLPACRDDETERERLMLCCYFHASASLAFVRVRRSLAVGLLAWLHIDWLARV